MEKEGIKKLIEDGKTALGIEFGSTRIKAVLADYDGNVLAMGGFSWENTLKDGIWTYSLEDVDKGMAACYSSLLEDVKAKYGIGITTLGALGISAMMHGYVALDKNDKQIAVFQTWRNTNTEQAADKLTELFNYNIPLRWSVAHLYQRILDGEAHVKELAFVNTLAGYVHHRLSGEKVLGVGDASGMFPIDSATHDYNQRMVDDFDKLIEPYGYSWKLRDLFPKVLVAGESAGCLSPKGAALLDLTGQLKPGIPMCPPEGDAGTGMTATNAVGPRTGNVSAGTSIFAMLVLEHDLKKLYREIDMVTTPSGHPVAMSHANNGTSDLNAWVHMFGEFCELMGIKADEGELFEKLYRHSLEGDPDCGGILSYGYYSGENVTFINEGRPMFMRTANSKLSLANFMKSHLYTSLGACKIGLDILMKDEGVKVDYLMGHGGLFKTEGVAQRYLSAAVNAPVTVMQTASEGGAWGIALLAAYMVDGFRSGKLEDYLSKRVFDKLAGSTLRADAKDVEGFEIFTKRYTDCLDVERTAIECIKW